MNMQLTGGEAASFDFSKSLCCKVFGFGPAGPGARFQPQRWSPARAGRAGLTASLKRVNSQTRIALARFGGAGVRTRSASIRVTSAPSVTPSSAAISINASQNTGSRLTEVA